MDGGAGLAADASGNIYLLDANGTFDTTLNGQGFPSQGDYGNAFLKISTTNKQLAVADYFEMSNQSSENSTDEDLGSGGALVLPDLTDNRVRLTTWPSAQGKTPTSTWWIATPWASSIPTANNIYQEVRNGLVGGVFSMPAYFNNTVYYGAVERQHARRLPSATRKLGSCASIADRAQLSLSGNDSQHFRQRNQQCDCLGSREHQPCGSARLRRHQSGNELYNSNQARAGATSSERATNSSPR